MAKKKAGKASKRVAKKKPAARKTATKKAPAKRVAKKSPAKKVPAKRPQPKGDGGPVLLSGGNPQIPKADGDAPVQAYIAAMPGWKHDVGRRIDDLVEAAVPGVRKAVRWNTPFYGAPGTDNGWFLAFHCITKYVKVTFFKGESLDPTPPVGSKMPSVRYFHIHENEPIDEKRFTAWIRQAARLPGERCF